MRAGTLWQRLCLFQASLSRLLSWLPFVVLTVISGCNLRCVFCQNHDIAHQRNGMDLTPEELGDWYIKLQEVGNVHNINLITPEQ